MQVAIKKQEQTPKTDLLTAIGNNRFRKVRELLSNNEIDVNNESKNGVYAIHLACVYSTCKMIQILLLNSVDINKRDSTGRTALHYLCNKPDIAKIKLLLENGADLNIPDISGKIPLHFAARRGDLEVVKLLVEAGSYLDQEDNNNKTPYNTAVETWWAKDVFGFPSGGSLGIKYFLEGATMTYNKKKRVPLTLLLCAKTFDEDSFFFNLPPDIFRNIIGLAHFKGHNWNRPDF